MSLAAFFFLAASSGIPDLPAYECIDANFVQHRELAALERTLELRGRMHVEKPGVLEWHVEEPFSYSYQFKQDVIVEVLPDGSRRQLDPDEAPWLVAIGRLLQATMAGDIVVLQEYFEISEVAASKEPDERRFLLRPLDEALASALQELEMSWNKWPDTLVIRTTDGGHSRIDFSNVTSCKRAEDSGS